MTELASKILNLDDVFRSVARASLALSGGVDSMTLAYIAHRAMGSHITMFHAVSPAVPKSATKRVEDYAKRLGWQLHILNAGEFADERYLANPAHRCYFCKSNLYGTLSKETDAQLFSGTNLDDLGDWRPGLKAAKQNTVRHPFVEAGFTKKDIRALASFHGLSDLAELPAAPCLSSRVETGIRIDPATLYSIDQTETLLQTMLKPKTLRCRVRAQEIVIELDQKTLVTLKAEQKHLIVSKMKECFAHMSDRPVVFSLYQRGSAFLREAAAKGTK